jgi:hypothetical protein
MFIFRDLLARSPVGQSSAFVPAIGGFDLVIKDDPESME